MRVLNSSPPFASDFFDISCVLLPSSPSVFSVLFPCSSFFLSKCQNDSPLSNYGSSLLCRVLSFTLIGIFLVSCTPIPLATHSAQSLNEIFHLDTCFTSFKTAWLSELICLCIIAELICYSIGQQHLFFPQFPILICSSHFHFLNLIKHETNIK